MNTTREPCAACKNDGWLLIFNTDRSAIELQRCDSCCRYSSDDEAKSAIAADPRILVTALFQLCATLIREVKKASDKTSTTKTEMTRLLATIRDSLQNAVDLRNQGDKSMKKQYFVGVREVHVRYYSVTASNPDEAKARVKERHASVADEEEQEYSHELEPDTWSVEEYHDE